MRFFFFSGVCLRFFLSFFSLSFPSSFLPLPLLFLLSSSSPFLVISSPLTHLHTYTHTHTHTHLIQHTHAHKMPLWSLLEDWRGPTRALGYHSGVFRDWRDSTRALGCLSGAFLEPRRDWRDPTRALGCFPGASLAS